MTKRILIADDEQNIVVSLEFLMQREGFDVFVAQDGDQALEMARDIYPDLIILDVVMPGKDGFEVCREIRAEPSLRGIRVLMLTVKGREAEKAKGLAMGADAYMTKPFAVQGLVDRVRDMLGMTV